MEDNSKFSSLEVGVTDQLSAEEAEMTEEVEEDSEEEIEMTEVQEEIMVIDHKEENSVTDQEDVSTAEKKDI